MPTQRPKVWQIRHLASGKCYLFWATEPGPTIALLEAGVHHCQPLQALWSQTQPGGLQCTQTSAPTLAAAQAQVAPELALWPHKRMTAALPYTRPTYNAIRDAAGDLIIPPDDLYREMVSGLTLTQAVMPSTKYEPLQRAYYDGKTYQDIYDLARHLGIRAERLFWLHDRGLLTPERIQSIRA